MKYTAILLTMGALTGITAHAQATNPGSPAPTPSAQTPPAATAAAETSKSEDEQSYVELGIRQFWGDVYGRPDLPFVPDIRTSKLNEYSDIRNGVILRRARIQMDNIGGTSNYFIYQTQHSFFRNQSHLATFGRWNKFKLQVRYDEIPHLFSNTARTLYQEVSPGVYSIPLSIRQALQTASSTGTAGQISNSLPSFVATQVIPLATPFLPRIQRKAISARLGVNLTPDWTVTFYYWREQETGTRPIGAFLYSSPSATASTSPGTVPNRQSPGTGAELPEPINYRNNTVDVSTEYGKNRWAFRAGYTGSFLEAVTKSLLFDNPFATADIPVQLISPGGGCTPSAPAVNCSIQATPAHGQMALYPSNRAHYLNFAGAFDATKRVHVMGSVSNGWLRQDDPFLPYTANTAITGLADLPATSLKGSKQTLAMNWTAVGKFGPNFELEAKYRHYDYNNNTQVFELTPLQGDTIAANSTATGQATPDTTDTLGRSNPGFNHKTLELSGVYNFNPRSAVRAGYQADWMNRSHRDVEHTLEHSVFATIDYSPNRDLLLRIGGRHQDRRPNQYQDEAASDPITGDPVACTSTSLVFTEEQRCHRRYDESARILNRIDAMVQYDLTNWSFTGSFQTIQSDFNRQGGTNSPVPLNFITGTTRPYYLYGTLNDLSWIYTGDVTYSFSPALSVFAEYSRELYHKRMVSRNRTPLSGTQNILTCNACDSANNDWESTARDIFDTYAGGLDINIGKRLTFSPYYTLAAGRNRVASRALGDPTITTTGPNRFALTGGSAAEDYPQAITRMHELSAVIKFKINENIIPRLEYRFQQFDNNDYQTTPMQPYMGCIGAGNVAVAAPCVNVGPTVATKVQSPYYPGFLVGDTAAARYLFLGVDQPSYRVHILTASVEFRF